MSLIPSAVGDMSANPFIAAETYVPDQLIAGVFPRVTTTITLAAGTLARGAVLGQVTATGNYILSVKTAVDGSQNPTMILVDAADASGGPVSAGAYETGEFNGNALVFDPSWSLATLTPALRALSIYVKSAVSAADPS